MPVLTQAVKSAHSNSELLLVLNSVALLKTLQPQLHFDLTLDMLAPTIVKKHKRVIEIKNRIAFANSGISVQRNQSTQGSTHAAP